MEKFWPFLALATACTMLVWWFALAPSGAPSFWVGDAARASSAAPLPAPLPLASPPPAHVWVHLSDLATPEYAAAHRPPAPGCPPPPALCRMEDVFDEIMVVALPFPKWAGRLARITGQLRALGTPYTLLHAIEAAEVVASGETMGQLRPSEQALARTQLRVFEYMAAASPDTHRHVLFLEDDCTLASDFPVAFDAAARALPPDWRVFLLGATMYSAPGCALPSEGPLLRRPSAPCVTRLFGCFSMALQRDAMAVSTESMLRKGYMLDMNDVDLMWNFKDAYVIARPPVVAMNPYYGTTMGNGWGAPVDHWMATNGITAARFDMQGPGYRAGWAAAPVAVPGQCSQADAGEIGVNFYGNDLPGDWAEPSGAKVLGSVQECCQACADIFPVCIAWTWYSPRCWVKASAAGRKAEWGFVSGTIQGAVARAG